MTHSPVVVLIDPQMGENIGAAARAMLNCGLTELRLVRPRDGWPNTQAEAMSSGALEKMPPVEVFQTAAESIADCHYVYATTARLRDMVKPVFTPEGAGADMRRREQQGQRTALVFGPERAGLTNDDVALCHAIISIPLNPEFSSLNLGQAVLLTAYSWRRTGEDVPACSLPTGESLPATHKELNDLCDRLETELAAHDFFHTDETRPHMARNLKSMLTRIGATAQEIRTFHGIITALTGKKKKAAE